MIKFIKKYRYAWPLLYIFIYMPWFMTLEATITPTSQFTTIHVPIDDLIPFCEYFIVPYLLWFLYIPAIFLFILFFSSKEEFYKTCTYFFVGMSICLFVCTIWPNGQDLRIPDFNGRDNIFTKLLGFVYHADTDTNVFPSIHSYNSVAAFYVLVECKRLKNNKWIKIASAIFSTLIIISTVVLKQHSIVDAIGGIILGLIMYVLVYKVDYKRLFHKNYTDNNVASITADNNDIKINQ